MRIQPREREGRPSRLAALAAAALAVLALGVWSAEPALAQERGTITGQVMERETMRPLGSMQISIPALAIGTLTQANGRFLLPNVPAGTHEIVAQSVGYETVRQEVTVGAGETVTVEFELRRRAIALDELVVTGVGVVEERRRLGQTIASVGPEQIQQSVAANLTEVLQGRISGMVSQPLGEVGATAPITLRGVASLSQRNHPVIYIDGVRVDNTHTVVSGAVTSPLNSLNVSDVERVEVIKGAAAATLYGTEASSGVIQITTRAGQAGPTRYTFQIEQEGSFLDSGKIPGNWKFDPANNNIAFNHPASDFLRTGWRQDYNLSISGGTEAVRYYASGRWSGQTGVLPVNANENRALRSSLTFQHSDRLESRFHVNLIRNILDVPFPSWGLVGEFTLADPTVSTELRPYGELFHTIQGALAERREQILDHLVLGGQASYQWRDNIRSELRIGYNSVEEEMRVQTPPGVAIRAMDGIRDLWDTNRNALTIDVNTSWNTQISPNVTSSLVVGGQSFWETTWNRRVGVRDFPSPGLRTLRGGASVFAVDEWAEEVINAGFFVQEQLGLWDRLFLTGGVRVDGNSAFGDDFGLQAYPKFGASWVVSDHPFWGGMDRLGWDHLRVRYAFGTSGLQPGAFDAQRTWAPTALLNNDAAVLPLNLGNPELKPERSIEHEIGFDAEFFGGRLGADVVFYHQRTMDALLQTPFPPSMGFLSPQLTNLGELRSRGIEASLDVAVVQRPRFSWRLSPQVAYMDQVIEDMGPVADFRVTGGRRWNMIARGHSPGAKVMPVADPNDPYRVAVPIEELTSLGQITPNFLRNAAGGDSLVFVGHSIPPLTGAITSSFELPRGIRVQALFTGAGNFVVSNETELIREAVAITERVAEFQQALANPNTPTAERQRIADEYGNKHPTRISDWVERADFVRFQELRVTYPLAPEVAGRVGLQSMEISLAARNLALWTRYSGMNDPGTTTPTGNPVSTIQLTPNIDYFGQPLPRRLVLNIRGSW